MAFLVTHPWRKILSRKGCYWVSKTLGLEKIQKVIEREPIWSRAFLHAFSYVLNFFPKTWQLNLCDFTCRKRFFLENIAHIWQCIGFNVVSRMNSYIYQSLHFQTIHWDGNFTIINKYGYYTKIILLISSVFLLNHLFFGMIDMIFDMIGVRDECQHGDAIPVSQQIAECEPLEGKPVKGK